MHIWVKNFNISAYLIRLADILGSIYVVEIIFLRTSDLSKCII